jgi:SAM-dependent methyltransferase
VLPALPPDRTTYWFTDVSGLFLDRAREKFPDFPGLRVGELDLERDPLTQGFAAGGFDVIVSANAVHATRDLPLSIERLRSLLAPGGLLFLIESTEHFAWFDVTTGSSKAGSGSRTTCGQCRCSGAEVARGARAVGFVDARAWPGEASRQRPSDSVIVAVAPGPAAQVNATPLERAGPSGVSSRDALPATGADAFRARLTSALPDERLALLRDFVRERVMAVLRLDLSQAPGPGQRLMDLGFDSLMAVQLRNQVGTGLGLSKMLPVTPLFDYPTIDAIAHHILVRLALTAPSLDGAPPPQARQARRCRRGNDRGGGRGHAARWPGQAVNQELSPLKRAFLALEDAQARLAAAEGALREPIAIIGLGCRVPGADDPAAFWRLLRDGVDAVGPVPGGRFDLDAVHDAAGEASGRSVTREAAFLRQVDEFDPGFFGIARREAQGMDPQQRLLLEVSWEALEHAGQAPDRLGLSATGVYFGICTSDYANLQLQAGDAALIDAHYTSGVAHSVASGRLSYVLGLRGPSISIDTACSSSLVAVHLACQALRAGDCRMALAGGVNIMLSPDLFVAFSHSRMLAPDGRCKTFDAAADGFGRGEGCGVIVLKRLSDARRRRPDFSPDTRQRRESGRSQQWSHGAERAGAGGSDPRGARPRRYRAERRWLCRGARHGHSARRPHRGPGPRRRLLGRPRARPSARADLGEDEHRPPRGRVGCRRAHQAGACPAAPGHPASSALPYAESAHPLE